MTYTKFQVKNKKAVSIPEYHLILPDKTHDKICDIDTLSDNRKQETQDVLHKGPEFLCEQNGFDVSVPPKKINSFYTIAMILSICIFVLTGFMIKYALSNDIRAPKSLYDFYNRTTYAFCEKSISAFYDFPDEHNTNEAESTISTFEESMYEQEPHHNIIFSENPTTVAASSAVPPVLSDTGAQAFAIEKSDVSHYGKTDIINETSYTPDLEQLQSSYVSVFSDNTQSYDLSLPLVLIYHSHGTESYSNNTDYYTKDTPTRSENTDYNVVSIGKELRDILSDFGINAIHCETMHDKDNYVDSYSNSAATIKEYIKKYPSIKYIIDIHRDSIVKQDGTKIRTYTEWGNGSAQIMLVVGSDGSGNTHPNWQRNLSLASQLQANLNQLYPTFARPINLRKARFNQQLCDGALLLEVGSCGNTLDDAKKAIKLFAPVYARTILESTHS